MITMPETVQEINERVIASQKNYRLNVGLLEDILMNERGFITRLPLNEDIVVLYSGGLDSTIMIDMMIKEWNVRVHPLYIRRGAKADRHEEAAVDYFYDYFSKKYPDNMGELKKISYEVPPKEFKEGFAKELAMAQGHPLRNATLQNIAVMYAVSLNGRYGLDIKTITAGSVGDDYTEPESGILSLRSQTLNACINLGDWDWQIISPLTDHIIRDKPIYKKDLVMYAVKNNIPLEKTRSCFSADEEADGTCFACQKRQKAFKDAGVRDQTRYAKSYQGDEK
jgi:7-cyano-7-deazaguanine synthase in queuosine biosynthesis